MQRWPRVAVCFPSLVYQAVEQGFALFEGDCDAVALLRGDEIVGVFGAATQVNLDSVDPAVEGGVGGEVVELPSYADGRGSGRAVCVGDDHGAVGLGAGDVFHDGQHGGDPASAWPAEAARASSERRNHPPAR